MAFAEAVLQAIRLNRMIAPWVEIFRASIASAGAQPLVLTLATTDEAGHPNARSVVCRQMDDDGTLWFTSDARSEKVRQLLRNPSAAAVCWLASIREQFRWAAGSVELMTDTASSDVTRIWHALSPESKAMFDWPAPGEPREPNNDRFSRTRNASQPPESFCVLVLRPHRVEQLRLSVHPHQRVRWTLKNHQWVRQELNP
jgi:PPOX class probable FMN-dependent enzyme